MSHARTDRYPRNKLYQHLGHTEKIILSVCNEGVAFKDGKLDYDPKIGKSWLSKLEKDLKGEVSRAKIDESLDFLLDDRILRHGATEMEPVIDEEGKKWVRGYYLGNEFVERVLMLYVATHDIPMVTQIAKTRVRQTSK
ncbi:MAG: hypothetical protein JRN52_09555 [Nitrososphaerota archaeon]|nr:hypothetical protein [Nitrososphaerota archaeon]